MPPTLHSEGQPDEPVGHSLTSSRLAPILQSHPLAERIPLPTEAEYAQVRDDIAENGQHLPIVRYEGLILDGRTRYRACRELGIEPLVRDFDPDLEGSPTLFVVSMNLARRSLTEEQRIATRQGFVADLRAEGMTNEAIARALGVSEPTVRRDQKERKLVRVGHHQRRDTKDHEDDSADMDSSIESDKSSIGPAQQPDLGPNRHDDDSEGAGQGPAGPRVITTSRGDKRPTTYAPRKPKATTKAQPRPIRPRTSRSTSEPEPTPAPAPDEVMSRRGQSRPSPLDMAQEQAVQRIVDWTNKWVDDIGQQVDGAYLEDVVFPTRFHDDLRNFRDLVNGWIGSWLGEGA